MPKRKRRTINWGPVLVVCSLFTAALGLCFSPITAPHSVRVVGARKPAEPSIRSVVDRLQGRPFASIDPTAVESAVQRIPAVERATFKRNIFGRAVLDLEYRTPVATVMTVPGAVLDAEGVIFRSSAAPGSKRPLHLPVEARHPSIALAQTWPSGAVASLCMRLEEIKQLVGYEVRLDATGRLSLRKDRSGTIELGGVEGMADKLNKLRQLLDERPELLKQVQKINLTDPTRPALVPLSRQKM